MLVSIATVLTFLSCSHVRRIIATEQERPGPASRESHRTDEESRLLLRRGKPRAVRLSERPPEEPLRVYGIDPRISSCPV